MNRQIEGMKRITAGMIVSCLKFFSAYPLGKGVVSLRARIDGTPKNIHVAKDARVRREAWLTCQEDSTIDIGEGSSISSYVKIKSTNAGYVRIGKHCSIHSFSVIYGDGGVTIGDNVRIATHTVIVPNNHKFDDAKKNIYEQGTERKPIHIKDDVWIGAHVTILAGVTIGAHAVIAAGAVVTKDVPENAIVAGVPAKVLRLRGEHK